jgi:DNA-binding FadR family transcriptional regulator
MVALRRTQLPRPQDLIEELVVTNRLQPGDKLPTEGELADQLGIGRSSVREALRSMETLGLVEVRHGRGMYLKEVSLIGLTAGISFWSRFYGRDGQSSLASIRTVRRAMEVGLVADAMSTIDAESRADLLAAVEGMESDAAEGQPSPNHDRDFHRALYARMDNWILSGIIDSFWQVRAESGAGAELTASDFVEIADAHRAIFDAMLSNDEDRAREAMRRHFTLGGA